MGAVRLETPLEKALAALSDDAFNRALGALQRFERRQTWRERPDGKVFQQGWFPSAAEDCGVSARVRYPTPTQPHSFLNACRTLTHCEALEGADHEVVLLVRRWLAAHDLAPCQVPASLLAEQRAARLLEAMDAAPSAPVAVSHRHRL